jgi:hypothetical protein
MRSMCNSTSIRLRRPCLLRTAMWMGSEVDVVDQLHRQTGSPVHQRNYAAIEALIDGNAVQARRSTGLRLVAE